MREIVRFPKACREFPNKITDAQRQHCIGYDPERVFPELPNRWAEKQENP